MADKGTPGDGPSLEMPSLPFRRRKRQPDAEDGTTTEAAPTALPRDDSPPVAPSVAPPSPTHHLPAAPGGEEERPRRRPQRPTRPSLPRPQHPGRPSVAARPGRPAVPGLPTLTGAPAALTTGAVVGALGVLLVWLASLGCEAARGTASCGDGPGFLVLAAVIVVLAYLGGALLRGFGVPDAGSTSLLAVGVMAVLIMVFFTDSLFDWWMALAVPVVSALAYTLSWWVSTQAVQTGGDEAPDRL